MTRAAVIVLLLTAAASSAVAQTAEPAGAVEELLRLHARQRAAHVLGDEAVLVANFADPLIDVTGGDVQSVTPAEARARFGAYFDAVVFLEWEDVRPPRIQVSADGTHAVVVVEKRVRTIPAGADPGVATGAGAASRFAWVETWDRSSGEWQLRTIASTDRATPSAEAVEPAARVRAHRILRRAREALGGREAVAAVHTLRFTAECEGPNGPFVTEVASARDGRMAMRQRYPGPDRAPFAAGRDLAGPWTGLDGTPRDSLGGVLSTFLAAHEMHLLALAPEARYRDPAAAGQEVVDGRAADVVAMRDALGATVRFYYDAETGRPVGYAPVNHTGRGAPDLLARFSDWRPVGDVILPHDIQIEQGTNTFTYRVTDASTAWLEDAAFRPDG